MHTTWLLCSISIPTLQTSQSIPSTTSCLFSYLHERVYWPVPRLRNLRRRPWSLGRWDCGFESGLRHGSLSSVFCFSVMCKYSPCGRMILRPRSPKRQSNSEPERVRTIGLELPHTSPNLAGSINMMNCSANSVKTNTWLTQLVAGSHHDRQSCICRGQNNTWTGFFPRPFGSTSTVSFYRCSIFTRVSSGGWTHGPVAAAVPQRQSHSIATTTVRGQVLQE
jgi:hypothetical protein